MRIGELAQRAGTTTKALRFYEQAGLLPAPTRTPSGYRDYDDAALDRLRFVKSAQTAGLTLAQVAEVIAAREQTGPPCAHVAALLDARAADLGGRIAELHALRKEVQRLRDRARRSTPRRAATTRSATSSPLEAPKAGVVRGVPAHKAPSHRSARGGSGGDPNRIKFPSRSTCAPSSSP